ncbi:MAG: hypothetical protein O3A00_23200 [Planctomycetota bacterium]|nr:hypothetical protein [Planctomycetota bacterium]
MSFTTTLVFYGLVGFATSLAVALHGSAANRFERCFQVLSAAVFWPMFLPFLLRPTEAFEAASKTTRNAPAVHDSLAQSIDHVEAELNAALKSLDGWAEHLLSHERDRFAELKSAWRQQAARVRELDDLLARPEFAVEAVPPADSSTDADQIAFRPTGSNPILRSTQARTENIARLSEIRHQLRSDLTGTLAWVRELVTMIHLAKFTGAPASRAEELVTQIAAAVEGLSEVTQWQDDDTRPVRRTSNLESESHAAVLS